MNVSATSTSPAPLPEAAGGTGDAAADAYFEACLGIRAAALLAPIEGTAPAGPWLRGAPGYRRIEQARRSDDATLPMGPWAVELKHADWPQVSTLGTELLATASKDLQLAAWLLEAEVHQRGFQALAPCLQLIRALCARWWPLLHPLVDDDGDFEARANIVRWINEKLPTALSLVPLVSHGERVASWSQWELAHHYERIRAAHGDLPEEAREAATLDALHALLAGMPPDVLVASHAELAAARAAIEDLEHELRARMHDQAPSLGKLDGLLARAQAPLRAEVVRRGGSLERAQEDAPPDDATGQAEDSAGDAAVTSPHVATVASDDREAAYRQLAAIAEVLVRVEPHSPVPYLLRRAVEWGRLDASALYHELFLKAGGQISIFELLGLDGGDAPSGDAS